MFASIFASIFNVQRLPMESAVNMYVICLIESNCRESSKGPTRELLRTMETKNASNFSWHVFIVSSLYLSNFYDRY